MTNMKYRPEAMQETPNTGFTLSLDACPKALTYYFYSLIWDTLHSLIPSPSFTRFWIPLWVLSWGEPGVWARHEADGGDAGGDGWEEVWCLQVVYGPVRKRLSRHQTIPGTSGVAGDADAGHWAPVFPWQHHWAPQVVSSFFFFGSSSGSWGLSLVSFSELGSTHTSLRRRPLRQSWRW